MKKRPFREHHLLKLLSDFDSTKGPLDYWISSYFKLNPALGSKDRADIVESLYTLYRWQGLLDHYLSPPCTWEKRFNLLKQQTIADLQSHEKLPLHIKVSFPKNLYSLLLNTYDDAKTQEICTISNSSAPTTIRVNLLKITRKELLDIWHQSYDVVPTTYSPMGITFNKKIALFQLPEFKKGLFEMQDEGSQLVAMQIKARPGQQVLDFCAGSGGKTLAFAPSMQNRGQIFLHDIRPKALLESRKRLRRAGIQNAQIVKSNKLESLKNKMDWVLLDVPCSGTGTLRRNPDMKWRFTEEMLNRLIQEQQHIFNESFQYLHPKGLLVYATCSLLKEENEEQVNFFLKNYPIQLVDKIFKSLPTPNGMDGFFAATFSRKDKSPIIKP